jgi:hypothetical protein
MGRGGGEGRVLSLMTAAVEREVSNSHFFLSSLMCRPWGIRLKRERNEVTRVLLRSYTPRQSSEKLTVVELGKVCLKEHSKGAWNRAPGLAPRALLKLQKQVNKRRLHHQTLRDLQNFYCRSAINLWFDQEAVVRPPPTRGRGWWVGGLGGL